MPEDNKAGHDPVISPSHYTSGRTWETIQVIKNELSPEGYRGFLKGNIIKYLSRYEHKGGVEDLRKARVYLDWLVAAAHAETIIQGED